MAEKGFGVKEVNLIGASGTPTITSPNNLNLNANNVAISTNVSIGGTLSVTGNVSVGGTLTYEDVTNIDSVGIITARDHVVVGGGLSVVGISTFSDIVKVMSGLDLQTNGTLDIIGSTSSSGLDIQSSASVQIGQNGFPNNDYATFTNTGVNLNYNNSTKLATTNTGVNVTGAITVNGSALSIDPTATDVQVAYELLSTSASGAGWRITGNGIINTVNNPDLYLIRGQKYRFINNSGGSHPFRIQSDSSTAYGTGVTNNNASSGNIDFVPRNDAPARLYYNCTNHGGMLGNIYLRGAGGQETNVGITTFNAPLEVQQSGVPAIISNYNNSKHIQMDVGSTGSGLHLTTGHHFAINHQPYADRTTNNNLTERFRITSTGIVNAPTQAGFYARMASNKNDKTGNGDYYTVEWDTDSGSICYDQHNTFSTSTGLYTIPTGGGGVYQFSTAVCLSTDVYGRRGEAWFLTNTGLRIFFDRRYFTSTTGTITGFYGSCIAKMTAGQTIGVQLFVSGGSKDVDVFGAGSSDHISWFTGRKIA